MYCPNCGTDNKEGSIYCNLCQEPLERYVPAAPQAAQTGQPGMTPGLPARVPAVPAPQGALVPPAAGFGRPGSPPPAYAAPYYEGPAFADGAPAPLQSPGYPVPPAYAGYGPYPVVIAQQSTPGEATAALVLGIIGMLLGCLMVPSILAIVFGIKARNMIDASEGFLGGRGMATAGLVLGIVSLGIWTFLDILSFALQWGNTAALALRLIPFLG